MSDKRKFPKCYAGAVAVELLAGLTPHCERVAVAGSLRRGKHEVGDVELLFIPKMIEVNDGLFDKRREPATDGLFADMMGLRLVKRPNIAGGFTWGTLNKLAVHIASGVPVDFFSEPNSEDWIRSLVIRTGPADLNIRLIQSAAKRGLRLHAYGAAFTKITTGETIQCPDNEREFFELCGVDYAVPEQRL